MLTRRDLVLLAVPARIHERTGARRLRRSNVETSYFSNFQVAATNCTLNHLNTNAALSIFDSAATSLLPSVVPGPPVTFCCIGIPNDRSTLYHPASPALRERAYTPRPKEK